MIRLVRDRDEIYQYKRLMFLTSGNADCPVLPMQPDVFRAARKLFEQEGVYLIAVLGDGQDCVFYLTSQKDMSRHYLGVSEINTNYNGENLNYLSYVDTSLIERADTYIFDEMEEYTFALTEFIMEKYPEKRVIYLDPYARYFFGDQIIYLESIYHIRDMQTGRCMYIKSDSLVRTNSGVPEFIMNTFSSENVMNSLCWAKNSLELGSFNADQTILLIDCDFGTGAGLAYIVRTVCIYAIMAYERGWIPVVNLTGRNMYLDSPDNNMWEQYFKPISNITVSEALKSRNVICVRNNCLDARAIWVNPCFRSIWHQGAEFDIFLRDEIIQQFEQKLPFPRIDKNVKVLGILVRGTDKPGLKKCADHTKKMLGECRTVFAEGKFDCLFLATEDQDYYDAFREEFGDRLISIDQKRVRGEELIGRQLSVPEGKRYEFGKTYLLVTYCLSKCDALLYNFKVGAYYLMNKWRKAPFEFEHQIGKEDMKYGLDRLLDCLEFIERHAVTAVYGTGNASDKLFAYLSKLLKKVIFVDQKAYKGDYFFHGIRVITPTELAVCCAEKKIDGIILASSQYAEEMESEIRKKGIKVKRIMRIGIEDFGK